jgi:hypothetical protein
VKTLASERDRAELIRRLRKIRPDSARRWGRMSAHEMICHLSDSCCMLTGERLTPPVSTPAPRVIMKWVALYAPMRWPPGISTTPELEQGAGGTRPTDFDADLGRLVDQMNAIASDRSGRLAKQPHPVFGEMSDPAWLRWAYLHTDHHLRQFGV